MTDLSADVNMSSMQEIADYFKVDMGVIVKAIMDGKAQTYQDVHNFIEATNISKEK